jgi:DNA-binding HxlR family transcriptional regulator
MQRKSFAGMACPIARSLERVGEWWSMLILRDAFAGKTRFDAFQQSLGIAPNMLSRRLAALVDAGMLERRAYSTRPPRDEYLLTERGRDFRTVLVALLAFGDRHFAVEGGGGARVVDVATGETAEPMLVDRRSGRPLVEPHFRIVRGRRAAAIGAAPAERTPANDAGLLAAPPPATSQGPSATRARRNPTPAKAATPRSRSAGA